MRPTIIAVLAILTSCAHSPKIGDTEISFIDSLTTRLSEWTDVKTIVPVPWSSPTIERLMNANESEIRQFWDTISVRGTPLVEECKDNRYLIVTFLYRNPDSRIQVHLEIKNFFLGNGGSDMMLLLIENTDIWYKTVKIPADWTTAYRYNVTDQTGILNLTDQYNSHLIPIGLDTNYSYNAFDYYLDRSKVWFYERTGVPKGGLTDYWIESKILKNSRSVVVYKPFGYDREKKYPTIVVFDQSLYLERVPLPVILDNLIAEKKIPPCVAILVDNQPRERREKELPLYKPFADFVALELMPWAIQNLSITSEPEKTILAGVSYGGLASSYIALNYSDIFGNVISQSGSYWRGIHVTDSIPWLTEQYRLSKKLSIRFYLDCGLQETVMRTFSNFNFIEKHREMRDVLKSKEYEIYYQEFQSGHDWTGWRKTLPDGLMVLFDKMQIDFREAAVTPDSLIIKSDSIRKYSKKLVRFYKEVLPAEIADTWYLPFDLPNRSDLKMIHIVSNYGTYRSGHVKGHRHSGLDIIPAAKNGTIEVYPLSKGVVCFVSPKAPNKTVIVRHLLKDGKYMYSSYIHLKDVFISNGQVVDQDSKIGVLYSKEEALKFDGNYDHLHLEIRKRIDDFSCASWLCMNREELDGYFHNPLEFLKSKIIKDK